jgi:hypothetical protein
LSSFSPSALRFEKTALAQRLADRVKPLDRLSQLAPCAGKTNQAHTEYQDGGPTVWDCGSRRVLIEEIIFNRKMISCRERLVIDEYFGDITVEVVVGAVNSATDLEEAPPLVFSPRIVISNGHSVSKSKYRMVARSAIAGAGWPGVGVGLL